MRHLICDTGRTADFGSHSERIYLAFSDTGISAGATFEVTDSELRGPEVVFAANLTTLRKEATCC